MGGFPGTGIPLIPGAGFAVAPSLPLIPQARPELTEAEAAARAHAAGTEPLERWKA